MQPQQFKKMAVRRFSKCQETMVTKAEEYSRGDDRLWNFKRAAALQGRTPAQALVGMWAKHLVSVMDMVESMAVGVVPDQAKVDEKIGDTINYCLLLEGLIEEQRDSDNPHNIEDDDWNPWDEK
jgi:hypothetical protein